MLFDGVKARRTSLFWFYAFLRYKSSRQEKRNAVEYNKPPGGWVRRLSTSRLASRSVSFQASITYHVFVFFFAEKLEKFSLFHTFLCNCPQEDKTGRSSHARKFCASLFIESEIFSRPHRKIKFLFFSFSLSLNFRRKTIEQSRGKVKTQTVNCTAKSRLKNQTC